MLDTDYNRKISNQIEEINRKYISHARKIGLGTQKGLLRVVGGSAYQNELNVDRVGGARRRVGRAITGGEETQMEGEGIFSGLLSDIGLGKKKGKGETGAGSTGGRRRRGKGETGAGNEEPVEGGRRRRRGKGETGAGIFSGLLSDIGLGKKGKGEPILNQVQEGGRRRRRGKGETGAGIFSGLLSDIGLGKKGKGETGAGGSGGRRRRVGKGDDNNNSSGGLLETVGHLLPLAEEALPLLALGKKKKGNKSKISDTGAGVSGGKKKTSPWIAHVKAFAKQHKMKYNEALKDPKCRASYK
jgi:hypothetical protein